MKTKVILRFFAATTILALAASCSGGSFKNIRGSVWNTTYSITYQSDADFRDSISSVLRNVELSLSPFNTASLITAINSGENDSVDSNIEIVFEASKKVNELSGGRFDPTVSPLINLWGFGYKKSEAATPSDAQVDSALSLVGISNCFINNGRMEKKTVGTEFNFSAITKGYGVDCVADMLRRNNVESYMVEIGGEISLSGKNPKNTKWKIQIDAPIENDTLVVHSRLLVIEATDCGIATSGNYRNFHTDSLGNRYGHTISPQTGRPIKTDVLSATVIAENCMMADALATACMTMSSCEAVEMIDKLTNTACLLVVADCNGALTLVRSVRFKNYER